MLSALRKSELCRFRIKQQGNKLEYLARQYEKKINKIAGHRAFFMADANQYIADEVQLDLLKMEYSIKLEFDKCRIENSALLAGQLIKLIVETFVLIFTLPCVYKDFMNLWKEK